MSFVRDFKRKPFEVVVFARAEFRAIVGVYLLDDTDETIGPLDLSAYDAFFGAIGKVGGAVAPLQVRRLTNYTFPGDAAVHPGALEVVCDPTGTEALQTEGLREAALDLFGRNASGAVEHIAEGFAEVNWAVTEDFSTEGGS